MSEVETLYARILSLVAPRELHSSCNGVLQYEISQLESSVKDLLAAYAKVEEVRDAVSKLEEGKAPSGRSASLMETMDCSLELQEELSKKLEKVATGMIVEAGAEERYIQATAVKRQKPKLKRKRTKEASSSSSSDTSSSSSEASSSSSEEEELNDAGTSALVETKKQKVLETPECRMDSQDLLQGVAKCLKAISTVKNGKRDYGADGH
ncbi:hypothetical protein PHYBOEH_003774 [Phytophthora boehmeriae]|uniref:Uncharacterized protein n=1 Tax=Phytophthora boehmeriae TaxID=109152 RepID=A0A8T1WPP8_9STRA|nr:hypothetical protein PHYBOEH_003774 [Phytophthora boehmeriae]